MPNKGESTDGKCKQVVGNDDDELEDAAADGKWDLAKKLRKNTRLMCMGEGCSNRAVATWVNLSTSEEWNGCEECQEKEFGPDEDEEDDLKDESGKPDKTAGTVAATETVTMELSDDADKKIQETSSPGVGKSEDSPSNKVNDPIEKEENRAASAKDSSDGKTKRESSGPKEKNPNKSNDPEENLNQRNVNNGGPEEHCRRLEDEEFSSIEEVTTTDSTPNDSVPKAYTEVRSGVATETDSEASITERTEKVETPFEVGASDDTPRNDKDEKKDGTSASTQGSPEEEAEGEVSKSIDEQEAEMKDSSEHPDENMEDDEDGAEEQWDLQKVFSESEILGPNPVLCDGDDCGLRACSLWVSNEDTKWHSCLDCQELDFEGWPPRGPELPINHMDSTHRVAIADHCTKQDRPKMPDVPCRKGSAKATSTCTAAQAKTVDAQSVTPTATRGYEDRETPSTLSSNAPRKDSSNATVTPSPKRKIAASSTKQKQPSAAALAMHRKWQEAAEAMGGPEARIVVSKPKAKGIIFDMMHEAFRPMNITEIYKNLKAVIPSPVLKSCLDDMAMGTKMSEEKLFAESDDEDGTPKASKPKKTPGTKTNGDDDEDSYNQSLRVKAGRNANTTLYFMDHSKLHNNGDGLLPDEKNKLLADSHSSKTEEDSLVESLRCVDSETLKLLSEPTNEEASTALEAAEDAMMDLRKELESSRCFADSAKHRKRLRVRIDNGAEHWRKRRRMCMDFLFAMEESTEGSFSSKKCLNGGDGGGPIEIDSDEAVAAGAVAFGKKKRSRGTRMAGNLSGKRQKSGTGPIGVLAREDFVAVKLGTHGTVTRILLDGDADN